MRCGHGQIIQDVVGMLVLEVQQWCAGSEILRVPTVREDSVS
jgi:hypothetical protein